MNPFHVEGGGAHPLRVLYAANSDADVGATRLHLSRHAPHIQIENVATAQALYSRLDAQAWESYMVILLDYHLPDANGLEVLKTIQTTMAAEIPVIVLTEIGGAELALQAFNLGAADFLVKHPEYLFRLPGTLESVHHRRQLVVERAALRASQQALQESEQRYRRLYQEFQTLLDAIPDQITLHTADLKIVWANREAGLKMGSEEDKALSRGCCDVFMGRDAPLGDCPVARTFKHAQGVHQADVRINDRSWDIRTVPIPEENGTLRKVIRVARDVTETRVLEQQLRQSQKLEAIGTLAGGIAHDFNNILAAVLGFDELALQHPRLDPEIRPHLNEIFKASLRAKDLVQQIMDFSHQGKQQVLPMKLAPVVAEALKLLRPALPSTIAIQTRLLSQRIIEADATQMHQVIVNLCTNAAHAMAPKGGTLVIALEDLHLDAAAPTAPDNLKPGDYVCLKVQDTGAGMPPQVVERIFEPYFTTKETGQGSGLGLAVVHGIVKGHGGAITVQSAVGRGSTFTVFLPAAVPLPENGPRPITVGGFPGGSETILYVDDEPVLAGLGEQILQRLGYAVKACTDPQAAADLFRGDPGAFDLLISDLTMPEMTGLELAEACRQARPDLPVIICSGHSDLILNDHASADRLKIGHFLKKPARLQDLATTIRRVLDGAVGP